MKYASRQHYAAHLAPIDIGDDLDVALVASYADLITVRRVGHRKIVLMQHGIGQSYSDTNPAYPGGRDNDDVGLFLVPGEHPADRWRTAYPHARVEVVGSPQLDDLPRRIPGPVTVAVTFHWRFGAFDFYREGMRDLAERVNVIGHGHPKASRVHRFWRKAGIEYVADFDDVCRRADVLVFDNTSVGYEFAATGRPVVVMDWPDMRDWRHGLRFGEAASVGVNVAEPSQLADAISRSLELRPGDVAAREHALDIVYGYRTGAAKRSEDVIADWAA